MVHDEIHDVYFTSSFENTLYVRPTPTLHYSLYLIVILKNVTIKCTSFDFVPQHFSPLCDDPCWRNSTTVDLTLTFLFFLGRLLSSTLSPHRSRFRHSTLRLLSFMSQGPPCVSSLLWTKVSWYFPSYTHLDTFPFFTLYVYVCIVKLTLSIVFSQSF